MKMIIMILILSLVPVLSAIAEDSQEKTIEGEVSATGIYTGVKGDGGGQAKFTEYKDLQQGISVYGGAKLKFDTDLYFLNFDGARFGYDTQSYNIDGGMWGKFKFNLFYREIPHNITFDARTFYLNPGRNPLVGAPNTNPATWNRFDYSVERRQYGGGLKVDLIRPFFVDVSFDREERFGLKPTGAAAGSPGDFPLELPEPFQYVTNNLKLEAGYAKKPIYLSLSYLYSDFNNSNNDLIFFNPLTPAFENFSLPPDNIYHKGIVKGAVMLPLQSRLSANLGIARGRSENSIAPTFVGRVENQNYDFAFTSRPARFLDIKTYYKYYMRSNRSSDGLGIATVFLNYRVSTYGAELGLRLPQSVYLNGGYKYIKTKRHKAGETDPAEFLPFNMDNIYFTDLKWTGLDSLETTLGYERMDRNVNYQSVESGGDPFRRFSYAAQKRDTYKALVDIFPMENLNVDFEYRFRNTNYSDTPYGLQKNKMHEVDVGADYMIGKIAKTYGYGDFGWIQFDQTQFKLAAAPFSLSTGEWKAKQKDQTYGYGIGTEFYVIPNKLTFIFQHDFLKSNGSVDYTIDPALFVAGNGLAGANNSNVDVNHWDDYTLYRFAVRAIYYITPALSLSAGYCYERFNYKDAQSDGYHFVNPVGGPVTGTNGTYLTGGYSNPTYRANVIFTGMSYKF